MNKKQLLDALQKVEQLAQGSKWQRLSHNPTRYLGAQYFRRFVYPRRRQGKLSSCHTFFGKQMQLVLPAGMDIYLTGGKTHPSELSLSRFFIEQIQTGDTVIDVGAHFGYYSLLASLLVGEKGQVHSFEPSQANRNLLQLNTAQTANISLHAEAVAESQGQLEFYEFPVLYSEYNTLKPEQFEGKPWLAKAQKVSVPTLALGPWLLEQNLKPRLIKIDVEGAEAQAVAGLLPFLKQAQTAVVLEFLAESRENSGHLQALQSLSQEGYLPHYLDAQGQMHRLEGSIGEYFQKRGLDSDNFVFQRQA